MSRSRVSVICETILLVCVWRARAFQRPWVTDAPPFHLAFRSTHSCLAVFFPPIVACIERGFGVELLLNIVLTIIGKCARQLQDAAGGSRAPPRPTLSVAAQVGSRA